jgi:hypothetical protein
MSTPAGWYPDAHATGGERYWDGQTWTDQRRDGQGRVPIPQPRDLPEEQPSWVAWAYVFAVLAPLIGLLIGLFHIGSHPTHAWRVIAVSIGAFAVYAYLVAAGVIGT